MKRDAGASVEKESSTSTSTNRQQPSGREAAAAAAATDAESFNGVPMTYKQGAPSSAVHCVGGDSRPSSESWMFRSCQFQNLCMDMETRDYVLVRDAVHDDWIPPLVPSATGTATDHNTLADYDNEYGVSLGGINPRWAIGKGFNKGIWKVRWFPKVIEASEVQGYYELPVDYVLVPFHSFAAHNVGHLLWDDFYPIFSLLRLFGLVPGDDKSSSKSSSKKLMMVRQRLGLNRTLYASCDIRGNKRKKCAANFAKFLPLMGVDPDSFSTSKDIRLQG